MYCCTLFIQYFCIDSYNVSVNKTNFHSDRRIPMKFEKEARQLYNIVHSIASRNQRTLTARDENDHPAVLSTITDMSKVAEAVCIGVMDIPVDKIVGVAAPGAENHLYTPDFMPLASEASDFAAKWRSLYRDYFTDEGIRNPISCYEYLGRFYIIDGQKRVSVLKSCGEAVISAQVVRLMPVESQDKEIQSYFQFMKHFCLTGLYQLSFNNPENFEKLQEALGYESDYVWKDTDRYSFLFNWNVFECIYKKVFTEEKHMTAADIFVSLLDEYSYSEITKMHAWELENALRAVWKKRYGSVIVNLEDVFPKIS